MAVKFFLAEVSDFATTIMLDELKKNNKEKRKQLVIIPDRYALTMEDRILEHLNLESAFNIEVCSIKRLAEKLRAKPLLPQLNQQTSIMLFKKVLYDCAGQLVYFKNVQKYAKALQDLFAVIVSLRNSAIRVEDLHKILPSLKDSYKNKFTDIVLVYEKYTEYLQHEYSDLTTLIEQLIEDIPNSFIKETDVYVAEFKSFNKVQKTVLTKLMETAFSFSLAIANKNDGENKRLYPKVNELEELSPFKVEKIYATQSFYLHNSIIKDNLFCFNQILPTENVENVKVAKYATQDEEIKDIASFIRYSVIKKGYRYKDFAISLGSVENYLVSAEKIFKMFEIPYHLDIAENFTNHIAVSALIESFRLIETGFNITNMLILVKIFFTNIDIKDASLFENYCYEYNINHRRLLEPFLLGEERRRTIAEKVRKTVIKFISPLMENANTVSEIIDNIKEFLVSNNFEEKLIELSKQQIEFGQSREASITEQIYGKIDIILKQTEQMLGDKIMPTVELFDMLLTAFETVKISLVPLHIDSVYIGDSLKSMFGKVKILICAGANGGEFPIQPKDSGFLTTRDTEELIKNKLMVEPNFFDRVSGNNFEILQLLLKSQDYLILTCNTDNGGQPASVFKTIQNLFNLELSASLINDFNEDISTEIIYNFATVENAIRLLAEDRAERDKGLIKEDYEIFDTLYQVLANKLGYKEIESLFVKKKEDDYLGLEMLEGESQSYTSVSAMQNFARCPYLYFLNTFLGLKERKKSEITVLDTGSIKHLILEKFFNDYEKFKNLDENSIEKEVYKISEQVFEQDCYKFLQNIDNFKTEKSNLQYSISKVIIEMVDGLKQGLLKPTFCEFKFGFGDAPPIKIYIDNKEVLIRGSVDRVDFLQEKLVVVDYKNTTNVSLECKDIYYGTKIQLLVYYKHLLGLLDKSFGGMFYQSTAYNYKKKNAENMERQFKGLFLKSSEFVNDVDINLNKIEQYNSPILEAKIDKKLKLALPSSAIMEEDYKFIAEYADKIVVQMLHNIKDGYIAKKPFDDSCRNCNAKAICGNTDNFCRKKKKIIVGDSEKLSESDEDNN